MTESNSIYDASGGLRPGWFSLPLAALNTVTLASLALPELQRRITPLKTALEFWRDTDKTDLIFGRVSELPYAHIPAIFVMRAYEVLTKDKHPFMVYTHRPTFSALEKIQLLEEDRAKIEHELGVGSLPQPVKTVSLRFKEAGHTRTALVTTIGDTRIDDSIKTELAMQLGLSSKAAKKSTFNPRDFDTTLRLGLIPGIIGPIIGPPLHVSISGICYVKSDLSDERFIELAVTPLDSLIMKEGIFKELFDEYAMKVYHAKKNDSGKFTLYSWTI